MGLSTGAALWASNKYDTNNFSKCRKKSKIFNPYLGPEFDNNEIERVLKRFSLNYTHYNDTDLATEVASAISNTEGCIYCDTQNSNNSKRSVEII